MIVVRLQLAEGQPAVVEIEEGRFPVEDILARAALRIFPGPRDPKDEARCKARFDAVMRARHPSRTASDH